MKLALEFTILTSMRTSEVLLAHWEEFDLDAKVWIVPAERLNVADDTEERGMKMGVEHKVPLSDRCIEILKLAKQFNDADIVFPGRSEGRHCPPLQC